MSFAFDFQTYLSGRGNLSAHVGTRVYYERAPLGAALPYIVHTQDGSDPTYSLTGETGTTADSFEVTAFAQTALKAMQIGDELRNVLSGYRGRMGSETRCDARIIDRFSGYETPDDGSDRGTYYCTLRIEVVHANELPTMVPTP